MSGVRTKQWSCVPLRVARSASPALQGQPIVVAALSVFQADSGGVKQGGTAGESRSRPYGTGAFCCYVRRLIEGKGESHVG